MKTLWVEKNITYTGEQLAPLYNYLEHGQLGNSMVAWVGPCQVTFEHMIDGEDLRAQASIASDSMVHFILELFDFPLKAGVVLQRLMAEATLRVFKKLNVSDQIISRFERKGDDLYLDGKKLNISIATASTQSTLIHFAVNVVVTGAPVAVAALSDFDIKPETFAREMLLSVVSEIQDILESSQKVRCF